MSSAAPQAKLTRPRRASRAPVRLGQDENAPAASGVPRAASAAVAAPGKAVLAGKQVVAPAGKAALQTQTGTQPARRAFGDVSNAQGAALRVHVDRTSKELPAKPTTRSRTASAQSGVSTTAAAPQPPSSTGTGIGRLTIGTGGARGAAAAPAARANRPARVPAAAGSSRAPAQPAAVAPAAPKIQQGEWDGAYAGPSAHALPPARGEHGALPVAGLGIATAEWDDEMAVDHGAHAHHGVKRAHEVERFDDDDGADDEPAAAFGGGHAHPHGAAAHEDKVRVLPAEGAEGDGAAAMELDPDDWLLALCDPDEAEESERVIEILRREFKEEVDWWDISMVAEYSDEIFKYMSELEDASMPNPRYMDHQTEIEWSMRTTLIDWLLQVHLRYHMLPETLWIAINIIDRFLSNRVVSLIKFQLVGVTAMFVAAKYEEIMAPSVEEFVFMTEGGYSREEILKGERIILQSLEFNISSYCTPYSWVRRISKADDYDIQTRTLSKFLMEVTLLDHRFLRAKPSMIAAVGMYLSRRMLGGDWNDAFIFYSNYTEAQLLVPAGFLLENLSQPGFEERFVFKKYSAKKFLKASIFARNWARQNAATEDA
ncbi:B-type cyclin [Rhodotorula kratochvilovae]